MALQRPLLNTDYWLLITVINSPPLRLARLRESGRVISEWAETLRREFREAKADRITLLTTPLLLKIVAQHEQAGP